MNKSVNVIKLKDYIYQNLVIPNTVLHKVHAKW